MTIGEARALDAAAQLPQLLREINQDVERRHIEDMIVRLQAKGKSFEYAKEVVRDARAFAAAVMAGEDDEE